MNYKHGACVNHRSSIPKAYVSWAKMLCRCYCSTDSRYKDYGGRGIRVCERWRYNYINFHEDMGDPPSNRHSIDRKDNDGDYTPENCRWATPRAQAENRRGTIMITFEGQTRSLKGWARHLDVNYYALRDRYIRGWGLARVLTTPLKGRFYERNK